MSRDNGNDARVRELALWLRWAGEHEYGRCDRHPPAVEQFGGGLVMASCLQDGEPRLDCYDRPACVAWHKAVVAELGQRVINDVRRHAKAEDLEAGLLRVLAESVWETEPGEDTVIHPENQEQGDEE